MYRGRLHCTMNVREIWNFSAILQNVLRIMLHVLISGMQEGVYALAKNFIELLLHDKSKHAYFSYIHSFVSDEFSSDSSVNS